MAVVNHALPTVAVFRLIPMPLTLAGIGGFVLSVGMAVDANILIFERMKEELRAGRGYTMALEIGFNRAWPSIRDSNVTTVITASILWLLGGGGIEVPSPTFTLHQAYELPDATVHHFDLFRLSGPEETRELGLEDAMAGGITLIEWPDRLGPLLPGDRLEVALAYADTPDSRRVTLSCHGAWAGRLGEIHG